MAGEGGGRCSVRLCSGGQYLSSVHELSHSLGVTRAQGLQLLHFYLYVVVVHGCVGLGQVDGEPRSVLADFLMGIIPERCRIFR